MSHPSGVKIINNWLFNCREQYKKGNTEAALQFCLDALEIYSGDDKAKLYAVKLQRLVNEKRWTRNISVKYAWSHYLRKKIFVASTTGIPLTLNQTCELFRK